MIPRAVGLARSPRRTSKVVAIRKRTAELYGRVTAYGKLVSGRGNRSQVSKKRASGESKYKEEGVWSSRSCFSWGEIRIHFAGGSVGDLLSKQICGKKPETNHENDPDHQRPGKLLATCGCARA